VIVDEFTGRLMPGRNWSEGFHQSVEAKEGVRIKEENQTLATITLQNFFKLYDRICGMTGTAMTEASEFWKIYHLDVIAVPTNRPMQRLNNADVIYRTEREKFNAIANEIERLNRWDIVQLNDNTEKVGTITQENDAEVTLAVKGSKEREIIPRDKIAHVQKHGRPVLVGTVSIEKSESLSGMLERRGVNHQVLNAKHHKREAEIISQAGRKGAVTIATNMAGRGTDIILGGNAETMAWAMLQEKYATRLDVPNDEWVNLVRSIEEREKMKPEGEEVRKLGGLHVLGTERHEARRIDLQLRGRCGRQGDPGSSRFYLSLEDDLMRIFAGEWVKNILTRLGMQDGEAIESRMVSRRIEGAQKKVEERNFDIRKNLLEYDEVMDEQRKRVYSYRQRILDGANCKTLILEMIEDQVDRNLTTFLDKDYGAETFAEWAGKELGVELKSADFRGIDFETAQRTAKDEACHQAEGQIFDAIEENLPTDEEESEWNWEALTKLANTRWKLSIRDRDLRKLGRDGVGEYLIERSRTAIEGVDLSEGGKALEEDFGLKSAIGWAHHKFGVKLDAEEVREIDTEAFRQLVREQATEAYNHKEAEYPVMAGFYHFTTRDGQGQKRYNKEALVEWARERFGVELHVEDLKNLDRTSVADRLIEHSRAQQKKADAALEEAHARIDALFAGHSDTVPAGRAIGAERLEELVEWVNQSFHGELTVAKLADLTLDPLRERIEMEVEEHFRPEMRRMERQLVLEILDAAWKDHL
ncbi:MAG: preprotein translocase subunit SecA, partial [Candidatus Hydrogenedentes bacterium]|nr:preprotein translocase subunit SecA [Candidatus Hydrogenedentota bacterium]